MVLSNVNPSSMDHRFVATLRKCLPLRKNSDAHSTQVAGPERLREGPESEWRYRAFAQRGSDPATPGAIGTPMKRTQSSTR